MKRSKLKKIATTVLASSMIFGMLGVNSNAWSYIPPDHDLGACGAAPHDYTGLGYFFKRDGIDIQVQGSSTLNTSTNNNSKIILGNISASLDKNPDGSADLDFYADYEIDMDCWTIYAAGGPGTMNSSPNVYTARNGDKAPNYLTGKPAASTKDISVTEVYNTFDYEFNTARELTDYIASASDGVAHYNTYNATSALRMYTNYSNPNWTTPMDRGNTSYNVTRPDGHTEGVKIDDFTVSNNFGKGYGYSWWGPDGVLQLKLRINGKYEYTACIPYTLPSHYEDISEEVYHHHFDESIHLDSVSGDINKVEIVSIEGTRVNMFLTPDGEACELGTSRTEGVGYVNAVEKGNSTTYGIKVNVFPDEQGVYDLKFRYWSNGVKVEEHLYGEYTEQFGFTPYYENRIAHDEYFQLTIPSDVDDIYLVDVTGVSGLATGSNRYINKKVDNWYFNFVMSQDRAVAGTRGVRFGEFYDYTVNVTGKYEFVFNYVTYENNLPVNHTIVKEYTIDSKSGRFIPEYMDQLVIPNEAAEAKLVCIKSPVGVVKSVNKIFYTNNAMLPEMPTRFNASIDCNQVDLNANGVNLHLTINYASPATETYRIVFEYEVDGRPYYKVVPLYAHERYGQVIYGIGTTNGNQPMAFPGNASYVKVYRVEKADGTPIDTQMGATVLYTCNHYYANDYDDLSCERCGKLRKASELICQHQYQCNSPYCDLCGEIRDVIPGHQYDNTCSDRDCNVCGYVRPISELSGHYYGRDYGTCTVTNCVNCGAERTYVSMNEHSYTYPCDVRCYDCQAIRNFVGERHRFESSDGSCIWCHAMPDPEPHVWNVTHYWLGYNERVDGKPVYYSGPLNNGEWGARMGVDSRMPAAIGYDGITFTVEYNGQVIYTGNGTTVTVDISKIPSGFAAGTYTFSFYEADGSFIYSDSCTVIDHE